MDRFETITAFVAVCDAGSLTGAARKLGLSPSVMSRHIAALEARLGTRLFHRTTRSISLTDAGGRFLARARRVLADLEEAEAAAQDEKAGPRGRLSVTAPVIFGRLHVAPMLARFVERYPQVTIDLTLSDRFVNLVEEGLDLAVRIGHLPDSQLIARRLGETRRALVASPVYLARAGIPLHPDELMKFSIVAFAPAAQPHHWSFAKDLEVRVEPRFIVNNGDAAISWALGGAGIARVLYYQVRDAIKDGRLVEVLQGFAPEPMPIHALYPTARLLPGKVRAFLDLIVEAADWRLSE